MPFNDSSLNRIGSNLIDFNLRVTAQADIGKSLLIIGTSSDGPVNVPVRIAEIGGLGVAVDVFGDVSKGSLLHTAMEANRANRRAKDIRLMRISNGNQAELCFKEVTISGEYGTSPPAKSVDEESYYCTSVPAIQMVDVLCLTAKYPGQIYNQVSVRAETGDGDLHPASQYVVIYNPKTAKESWFSYNYVDFDAIVDCHTVEDLASAINADSNLNSIITATVKDLRAIFELTVSDPTDPANTRCDRGISYDSNGYLKIQLSEITPVFYNDNANCCIANVTTTGGTCNVPTAGDLIVQFNELYEIREYKESNKTLKGFTNCILDHIPVKGVATIPTTTLIKYRSLTDNEYATPQIVLHYRGIVIATITDTGTLAFEFASEICPDDGRVTDLYCDATDSMYRMNHAQVGADRSNVQLDDLQSSFHLYGTKSSLKYEIPSGYYKCDYDYANEIVTVTFCSGDVLPAVGTILSCDYDSCIEDLSSEAGTLTACLNSNDWHTWFVSGKTLTFGKSLPGNASFRYRYKNKLEEGADFVITSSTGRKNDVIQFTSLETQPDLSGAMDTSGILLGFDYIYLPEWIDVGAVETLTGGTNGIDMNNFEKYEVLNEALEVIQDYPVSYIVLAGMYFDDIKTVYDPETGTPLETSAGFHTLLHNHLEELTGSTSETIGIMSVKPADGNTPADIKAWVEKLTVTDASDPNRAANILSSFGSKYMTIVAGELIFSNEAAYIPYANTADGLYGGLLSALPVNTAPSNKTVFGVTNVRYLMSGGENGQLDRLTKARLVTFRQKQDGDIAIVSGITAAPSGSDYQREMTRNTVFESMALIRAVCEPFLGEGNSPQIRAAMETAINSALQKMVEMNPPALREYDFTIRSTAADQVLGILNIDLVLVPVFELREIRVTVKLQTEL